MAACPAWNDDAVKLAVSVLPAYQAMVSPSGGIFYGPWNMASNTGSIADPFQLSNENNFSSLAGLTMLQTVLEHNNDQEYLSLVTSLVAGIEQYLQNNLYVETNNCFYTGGTYAATDSTPTNPIWGGAFTRGGANFPFAVDVHTWGCSVLGIDRVDKWFGTGTAYNLWQTVKSRAGYFVDGDTSLSILGVGYTDVPTGSDIPKPHEFIISAEWTFGAINMCRVIGQQYLEKSRTSDVIHAPIYAGYASSLFKDAETMMQGVQSLLLDSDSIDP